MKVLELFSGTRSVGKAFERRGHDVFSVEWDEQFDADMHEDVENLTAKTVLREFGEPDVIWASPDCTTFSVAAISHHRDKDDNTGTLTPRSEYAKKCDRVDLQMVRLIRDLRPKLYFIENPRGGVQEDGLDAVGPSIHSHLLQVRRQTHEANRHIHEPPGPEVQASLQERGPVPRARAERGENRHAGAREGRQVTHT